MRTSTARRLPAITGGYDKGVEDEVFLDLTPYIEEYAPNYNAIINMNDQNRRGRRDR